MTIPLLKYEFSGHARWEFWVVVNADDGLRAGPLDATDEAAARIEADNPDGPPVVALVKVGHVFYNSVPPDFVHQIADRTLEFVAKQLGERYAQEGDR